MKYPGRAISNAPVVFPFQQNLAPQFFQTIESRQGGQAKQSSYDDRGFISTGQARVGSKSLDRGMSLSGLKAKYSLRADLFRFATELGH